MKKIGTSEIFLGTFVVYAYPLLLQYFSVLRTTKVKLDTLYYLVISQLVQAKFSSCAVLCLPLIWFRLYKTSFSFIEVSSFCV
jgi:hypothetical protein